MLPRRSASSPLFLRGTPLIRQLQRMYLRKLNCIITDSLIKVNLYSLAFLCANYAKNHHGSFLKEPPSRFRFPRRHPYTEREKKSRQARQNERGARRLSCLSRERRVDVFTTHDVIYSAFRTSYGDNIPTNFPVASPVSVTRSARSFVRRSPEWWNRASASATARVGGMNL